MAKLVFCFDVNVTCYNTTHNTKTVVVSEFGEFIKFSVCITYPRNMNVKQRSQELGVVKGMDRRERRGRGGGQTHACQSLNIIQPTECRGKDNGAGEVRTLRTKLETGTACVICIWCVCKRERERESCE